MNPLIHTSQNLISTILSICAVSIASIKNVPSLMANYYGDNIRPRVDVKLNNVTHSWLYDTGAAKSCMPTKTFLELFPNKILNQRSRNSNLSNLRDAGGNSLGLYGIFSLPITILGKTFQHDIWVCDRITDSIIGADIINKYHLSYDTLSRSVHWRNLSHQPVLSLQKETRFAPLSTQIIKAKFHGHTEAFAPHIATIFSDQTKLIQGGPALVSISNDGFCTIAVTNCAPYEICLNRGSIIGMVEIEDRHSDIQKLSQQKANEIFNTIGAIKDPTISSGKLTREEIVKRVNLHVPAEFRAQYIDILFKHRQALSVSKTDLGRAKNYFHRIHLKDKFPVYRKQFKIPDAHSDFISKSIDDWIKLGVVRRTNSMYNSPIFCVPKKNGTGLRIVQDFRELNLHSHIDKYSMKEINECIGDIGRAGSTIFSTLDLTSGFWQMPLHPNDAHLTAFTVPSKGQFEWITSPMGLLGCPASFQRLMEATMEGIEKVIVYIDDLLIHSKTHPEQLLILDSVMERLEANGLKINLDKCVFGNQEVSYLGFTLTPNGISPGKDKLQAIRDAKAPTDIKMVRSFIGLCNFFRTHIKNFATISAPLTKLTRKDSNYNGGQLPPEAYRAYLQLKLALTSDPVVAYPRSDRQYALIVDASTGSATIEGGMGAILTQQDRNGNFHVISYGSRQLIKHEKNYSPYLLEMAAAVWGMEFYNEYLKGKQFTLYTDHKPLERLSHLHTKTLNRLQLAMLEYDFVIQYKKGINMPADFLSRTKIDEIAAIDPFTPTLAQEQAQDPDVIKIKHFHTNASWPANTSKQDKKRLGPLLSKFFVRDGCIWIRLQDHERQRNALFLPHKFRKRAMCDAHGTILTGHDAVTKTYIRISDSYFWPGMVTDITKHIQSCLQCQVRKTSKPKQVPLHPLPVVDQPNQRVHIDLFGPLKISGNQNKFILCITDAFTKYAEVVAIPDKQAETVANEIFTNWICRFGSPIQIHSDGGKEFCNKLADELFELLGIKHTKTSPAHPQCNSQVEVFNKTVAKYLSSFVNETTLDWEQYIPALMFAYNTSYHSTIMSTPFELLYGMKPRLPSFPNQDIQRLHYGESFASQRLQILQKARLIAFENAQTKGEGYKTQFDKQTSAHTYQLGDLVLYHEQNFLGKNKKLAPKWLGPATVVKVNETNVHIKCKTGKIKLLNVSHIKKFYIPQAEHDSAEEDEFEFLDPQQNPSPPNEVLSEPQAQRAQTRALTRLLQEHHTINYVEADLRAQLSRISVHLYRDNLNFDALSQADQLLWKSFSVEDIHFFLSGQRERTPDYATYLKIHKIPNLQQPISLPNSPAGSPDSTPFQTPNSSPFNSPESSPSPTVRKPWPNFHANIDPRNILKTPLSRLTRSASKKWARFRSQND
jgi:hypothetical protein